MTETTKAASNASKAAFNALMIIEAVYDWVDRVDEAGGTTSLGGISVCHSMLQSLRKNRRRLDDLVRAPLLSALREEEGK